MLVAARVVVGQAEEVMEVGVVGVRLGEGVQLVGGRVRVACLEEGLGVADGGDPLGRGLAALVWSKTSAAFL